jgi:nitrogen fixation protein NifB
MVYKYDIKKIHPCFGSIPNKGRIHLPVCPNCNIECNFCNRKINDYEERPGVASVILSPDEAVKVLKKALDICADITVAGIAGPGDTLAFDKALETFALIGKNYPHLIKCMSTNGLLLNERGKELLKLGIDTLTVTVNAVDPKILTGIVSRIIYHGKIYEGEEAGKILIHNQLAGIRKMAQAGIMVKVNTVLIKELNRHHIKDIARAVKEAGASLYNIIPLIPAHKMSSYQVPGCEDINGARREAQNYLEVFRHCSHCRADAAGIPGKLEISGQIYTRPLLYKETFSHG